MSASERASDTYIGKHCTCAEKGCGAVNGGKDSLDVSFACTRNGLRKGKDSGRGKEEEREKKQRTKARESGVTRGRGRVALLNVAAHLLRKGRGKGKKERNALLSV